MRNVLPGIKYKMTIVFPGQSIGSLIEEERESFKNENGNGQKEKTSNLKIQIQIGPGIIQNGPELVPLKSGSLQNMKQGTKFILNSPQKRYIPLQNDLVIGIITAKLAEFFRVDIGSQSSAVLSILSGFEGATKKNKPNWIVGTVIFARVAMAHPDLEPELACFDPSGNISVDLFGELGRSAETEQSKTIFNEKCSTILRTTCNFSKKLQNPSKNSLIPILGRFLAFEIAAGANGRIFIESGNPHETIAISQLILEIHDKDSFDPEEFKGKVREMLTARNNK